MFAAPESAASIRLGHFNAKARRTSVALMQQQFGEWHERRLIRTQSLPQRAIVPYISTLSGMLPNVVAPQLSQSVVVNNVCLHQPRFESLDRVG
jgi:hypothetical protein